MGQGDQSYMADIDLSHPGLEPAGGRFYYFSKGIHLLGRTPPEDLMAWWDADLLREFVTRGGLAKWSGEAPSPPEAPRMEGMAVGRRHPR